RNKITENTVLDIQHLADLAQIIFQKAVDCLFTGDLKVANGVLEMQKVLELESDKLVLALPEIPFLRAMISCLTKIADLGASIADIAINRALEKPSKDVEEIIRTVKHVRTVPLAMKKRDLS
ncbi:MAG: hypothetical protein QXL38_03205, partial [Candidatus Bathyarchaeia archaeon]